MQYKQYLYTTNLDGYFITNPTHNLRDRQILAQSEILGHIRFKQTNFSIHEVMYLRRTSIYSTHQYYKVDWFEYTEGNQPAEALYITEIEVTDLNVDERYYSIVFDIKEICVESPEIDEILIMHDVLNIHSLLWEYICNLYAGVYWCQDNITPIPNYVAGFLRNITSADIHWAKGTDTRIPLLSAMIYSHGVRAITDMLEYIEHRNILIDIVDNSSPLFALWHMLDGSFRKRIWDIFDLIDDYYEENYRILIVGPLRNGKNLLQTIFEDAYYTNPIGMAEVYNYIAEVRDPDWILPTN